MMRRRASHFLYFVGFMLASVAIALGVLAWHLSQGPVSLRFLNSTLSETLSDPQSGLRVTLDDTIIHWGGWQRNLDIRVLNLTLSDSKTGQQWVHIPQAAVQFSAEALLDGVLLPEAVELLEPQILLHRTAEGALSFQLSTSEENTDSGLMADEGSRAIVEAFLASRGPFRYLDVVQVSGGVLALRDDNWGMPWHIPRFDANLRRAPDKLFIETLFQVDMSVVEGVPLTDSTATATVALNATHVWKSPLTEFSLTLNQLRPTFLADVVPQLAELARLDMAVDGTITGTLNAAGEPLSAHLSLTSEGGQIHLPEPLQQSVAVATVRIDSDYDAAQERVLINQAIIDFAEDASLTLPAPVDHRYSPRSVALRGHYALTSGELELKQAQIDLGDGVRAGFSARMIPAATNSNIAFDGWVENALIDRARDYWPASIGPNAYEWVTSHMRQGRVSRATVQVQLRMDAQRQVQLQSLGGTIDVVGTQVSYLDPMPPVSGINSHITYDAQTMTITVTSGQIGALQLRQGTVFFSGFDKADQWADIRFSATGPLAETLALVDSKPLEYVSALGLDATAASGQAEAEVHLKFPVTKTLTLANVEVSAHAKLSQVTLAKPVAEVNLSAGTLTLAVDKQGMIVEGEAQLGGIPVALAWRENFTRDAPFASRYQVAGRVTPRQLVDQLGFAGAEIATRYAQGAAETQLEITQFHNDHSQLHAVLGVKQMTLALPPLGWSKPSGVAGQAEIKLQFDAQGIRQIDRFQIIAGDLRASGRARFFPQGGGLQTLAVDHFATARNQLSATISVNETGSQQITVTGASLDLAPFREELLTAKPEDGDGKADSGPPLSLAFTLARVWMTPERGLSEVSGRLVRDGHDRWVVAEVAGHLPGGGQLLVNLRPSVQGPRELTVAANDAGDLLATLGLYDNMRGGQLNLSGRYANDAPDSALDGTLDVRDYRIVEAPVLAQIISLAAITGVVDRLSGEGLAFQQLTSHFTRQGAVTTLRDGLAAGRSLGLTFEGFYDSAADTMDLEGTLVPAYMFNSLIGKLPLIGNILTGGEKGGGIFGASYRVKGALDTPEITINPLSALAPGPLKSLLAPLMDKGDGPAKQSP